MYFYIIDFWWYRNNELLKRNGFTIELSPFLMSRQDSSIHHHKQMCKTYLPCEHELLKKKKVFLFFFIQFKQNHLYTIFAWSFSITQSRDDGCLCSRESSMCGKKKISYFSWWCFISCWTNDKSLCTIRFVANCLRKIMEFPFFVQSSKEI